MRSSLLSVGLLVLIGNQVWAADVNVPLPPAAGPAFAASPGVGGSYVQYGPAMGGEYYAPAGNYGAPMYGSQSSGSGYWQPGGFSARVGSPYYYSASDGYGLGNGNPPQAYSPGPYWPNGAVSQGAGMGGDPYSRHFGPGFYRNSEYGHTWFPYYSYRRPWYYPGTPVFNRDTNLAW